MVRFSLGEDSSDDDAAVIAKAPPTRFLKNKPESPPVVRQPPPCRLRQCALELQLLRDREAQKRSEKKLAPFRARIQALGDAGDCPPPEAAMRALELADKAALEVKERQDADIKRDMERARREAALRHAASKQRCEAIENERSRRKEAEAAAKLQHEARQVLASPEAWDDLESLETLDGLRDEDRAAIQRAKACVAAILKHLASARKASSEKAFTEARRGLTEQLALLKQRKCGLLTETSAAGRAASDAISKLDDALKQLAAVPVAKAPAPAPAPSAGDARSQVVAIYETCNPTKLGEVDNLLAKYAGREAELIARLRKKYAAQLGGFGAPAPPAAPATPPAPAPSTADAETRARAAQTEAQQASSTITSQTTLKPLARSLKKKVGAAVNSVGNDCASALKCAETLSDLVEDPLGRKTKAPSNPFGAFGGGAASQPLHVAHGGALQQCGVDDGTVARFAAHLACDKLLEKLTGETFDRRKDVWALAACVCEFVAKDTTSFRRELFQAKLRDASPSSLAKPAEGADASKTAALCAALCIVDTPSMRGHPFGGLGAAWCWLARAANNSFEEADAALPPLVAFLETAAPFLLKAYGRPAGELLQLLGGVAAASKGGAAANLASANISDLVDRAGRGQLTVPETFTTFTAPA
jgi:hypothetical protein